MGRIHTLWCRSHEKLWESDGKSDWQQNLVREGTSCFSNPSPRSPLLLIRGHESAGSYWLQNRPILSLPIYLLKSSWCPCYFTFHAFSRVGWVVEKKSVVEARRGNAPISCMIKCYRLFDCNTTWFSAKTALFSSCTYIHPWLSKIHAMRD